MNINDYTYHICDRFVLVFIAFVGLCGTSYILISGNLACSSSTFNNITIGLEHSIKNHVHPTDKSILEANTLIQISDINNEQVVLPFEEIELHPETSLAIEK
jgi:hypothetical protein